MLSIAADSPNNKRTNCINDTLARVHEHRSERRAMLLDMFMTLLPGYATRYSRDKQLNYASAIYSTQNVWMFF